MAILRSPTVSTRRKARQAPTVQLTAEERANVRRVLQHLTVEIGSHVKLARALGMTSGALTQQKVPSGAPSPRLAFAVARIAGVGVDEVLAGRWKRCTCQACGAVVIG